ncbi:MAG: C10 family peptidase [Deltaproteobacteria bacterium]|nr:C10 family peptidase [Deltaproteobacteria bacterium]
MKERKYNRGAAVFFLLLFSWFLLLPAASSFGRVVTAEEAVAVADYWYAREVGSGRLKLSRAAREARLRQIASHEVFYLVEGGKLAASPPADGQVLAYVVKYQPTGYVVVTAEDRLQPVTAFDVFSEFRWDDPERNFLRHFLDRDLPRRWRRLKRQSRRRRAAVAPHRNWARLRSRIARKRAAGKITGMVNEGEPGADEDTGGTTTTDTGEAYVFLDTPRWGQGTYYNDEVVAHNGNTGGVLTGCTATAMAIKMRFHQWPPIGSSSRSYTDYWGSVRYSHSRDFSTTLYNWSAMPTGVLNSVNTDIASLMYDCGVAVRMNYEVGNSTAWPSATAMNTYFRYRGTVQLTADHEEAIRESIIAHLPVVACSSAHTVVISGYRDSPAPYFYVNAGWNGSSNGWYSLDHLPGGDPTIDRSYPYGAPDNFVYVDSGWTGTETGDLQTPYNTIAEGEASVPAQGHLWLKGGTYTGSGNSPLVITAPMTVEVFAGAVVIK